MNTYKFLGVYTLVLSTILSASVVMSEASTLEQCVEISDDTARLTCYDNAVANEPKSVENPSVEAAVPYSGNWYFQEAYDDFTDKDSSFLMLSSDITGRRGRDYPSQIIMRCDSQNSFEIYAKFNGYVGARNNRVPIRFRFDGQEAVSERWSKSTDGTAAFLPSSYRQFKAGLFSGADFIFGVSDYNGSQSSAKFTNSVHPKLEFIKSGCK